MSKSSKNAMMRMDDDVEGGSDYKKQADENGLPKLDLTKSPSRISGWRSWLYHWPWVTSFALVVLVTGLIMWAATTSPALNKTKEAIDDIGTMIVPLFILM